MKEMKSKPFERVIFVCCNTREDGKDACGSRGSDGIRERLKQVVKAKNLKKRLRVCRSMCLDLCSIGPNVCIMPDNIWYHDVKPEDVEAIVEKHIAPLEKGPARTE